MDGKQPELAKHADVCTVCELSVADVEHPTTAEYLGKVLSFCSPKCYQEYLQDPARYAAFADDEELE